MIAYVTHADTWSDGINFDGAKIQQAIDATPVGGTVWLQPGRQHLIEPPGIVLSDSKKLWGNGSMLKLSQPNMDGITIRGAGCKVEDVLIANEHFCFADSSNVVLDGCQDAVLEEVRSVGGFYGLKFRRCADNRIEGGKFDSVYGPSVVHSAHAAPGFLRRVKIDTQWPVTMPTESNFVGKWQARKNYKVGDVAVVGGIYQAQCVVAGVSGSVEPPPKPYYETMYDGACEWFFVNMIDSAAILLDTGTGGPSIDSCDMTGCYAWGVIIQNTLGDGDAPQLVTIRNSECGQAIYGGVKIKDAAGTRLFGNVMDAGRRALSAGINIEGGSDAMIYDNKIYGFAYGITANGGSDTALGGNRVMGWTNQPIYVAPGVSIHDGGSVTARSPVWG
jgi:hypothetical protein